MFVSTSRLTTCLLLAAFLISSCGASSSAEDAYPTYDPFAPVGGSGDQVGPVPVGESVQATRLEGGPTPTRAPLSFKLPESNPNSSSSRTTPTPDFPHPVPTQRDVLDQYTVQAGDTLGSIASAYGISLTALMQANGLDETSMLTVGLVLEIPPIEGDLSPGASFKLIPDSELVYGPAAAQFDIGMFVENKGGYLADYSQDVNGDYRTGVEALEFVAQSYSVNPRLLLALLEYRSGWVTNPTPQNVDYPLGYYDDYHAGLYRQLTWAANSLNKGYYLWKVNALSAVPLSDGTYVPLAATINAGTAGVQYFLSLFNSRTFWDYDVSELGFFQTYNDLFGYPFDYTVPALIPQNLTQPPMQLPFEPGSTWSYTGGPHGGWDSGSGWAALDFAPPGEPAGCIYSDAWVVAVANGWIVRAGDGAVIQDLDNDGYEQTGWNVLYMHIETRDRVPANTYVYAGERIGHPSCEGGFSNGTHVHLARKYNGEWISADGALPFNMEGWVSSGAGYEYDGYLTRGNVVLEALEGVFEGQNQISR